VSERNVALITGITGQDGALLAEYLLNKGYTVHGIKRRSSSFNSQRIDHLYEDPHSEGVRFKLHYGDLTDASNLLSIMQTVKPSEVYNLAAQSHVKVSFETPEYTANADALGTLRLLEAVRILNMEEGIRFYQASTSEMYGNTGHEVQNEKTAFAPVSPYGVAKLYSHHITGVYRSSYGIHASCGICFNHEGPTRGETFVTRKITQAVARISLGSEECLFLGNMNATRDWGDARDYVRGMWLMLQQDIPADYVLATGVSYSVRDFVETAFKAINKEIEWQGEGVSELGLDKKSGRTMVRVDPGYFRPNELHNLCGDASLARDRLGWIPQIPFQTMVKNMVKNDITVLKRKY
jgi:GDPmannose 4,6-dehydratase